MLYHCNGYQNIHCNLILYQNGTMMKKAVNYSSDTNGMRSTNAMKVMRMMKMTKWMRRMFGCVSL